MAIKIKIPETGIYIMSGEPGSGKSYKALLNMIEDVKRLRPVYTNIPINVKTIRAYFRLTSEFDEQTIRNLPKYLKIVTKDHFDRFTARLQRYSVEKERLINERDIDHNLCDLSDADHNKIHKQSIVNVDAEIGKPKLTGGGADWIPHGASLYLDELHLWYKAQSKTESLAILAYTSMHRHMMHKCTVLSQHPMQVSLAFRRMAVEYTFCRDWSKIPFMWIIKIPIKLFKYNTYSSMDVKAGEPDQFAKPTWSEAHAPIFSGFGIYRLYNSFTHAGDIKEINYMMEKTRAEIEGREPKKEKLMKTKISRKKRFTYFMMKTMFYSLSVILFMKLGSCGESFKYKALEKRLDEQIKIIESNNIEQSNNKIETDKKDEKKQNNGLPVFEITAITKRGAIIDGKFRKFNQYTKGGFKFTAIKEEGRICIFVHEKTLLFMLVDIDGNVQYGVPKTKKLPSNVQNSVEQPAKNPEPNSENKTEVVR